MPLAPKTAGVIFLLIIIIVCNNLFVTGFYSLSTSPDEPRVLDIFLIHHPPWGIEHPPFSSLSIALGLFKGPHSHLWERLEDPARPMVCAVARSIDASRGTPFQEKGSMFGDFERRIDDILGIYIFFWNDASRLEKTKDKLNTCRLEVRTDNPSHSRSSSVGPRFYNIVSVCTSPYIQL